MTDQPIRKPLAFAIDYDRTLADLGKGPDPEAMQAIQGLRKAGIHCILATGRPAEDLIRQGLTAADFDAYVIEGGALFGPLTDLVYLDIGKDLEKAAEQCKAAGIPFERRTYSFAVHRHHEAQVRNLVGECSVQPNVDHLDVLPPRIDKGTGLDGALSSLGNRGMVVIAIGDGENDIPLFERAHVGLATASAVPALKAVADEVLAEDGPRAVVAAAQRILRGDWDAQLSGEVGQ